MATLNASRVSELQYELMVERARRAAAENALAHERAERERDSTRVIEMGRALIAAQDEARQARAALAGLEPAMRAQLREELRQRVQFEADQACAARVRELDDTLGNARPPQYPGGPGGTFTRTLRAQDVVDLRETLLGAFEDARQIARRGL